MMFFSLRLGKRQRVVLAAVCCCAVVVLAGRGLAGRFALRTAGQEGAVPALAQAGEGDASRNEGRKNFLLGLGYQTEDEPEEAVDVLIPETFDEVYENYNALQKQQGYDLEKYRGKKVKRYRYRLLNYPRKKEAAATLLVYQGEIIGGDVTVGGETSQVRRLAFPQEQEE